MRIPRFCILLLPLLCHAGARFDAWQVIGPGGGGAQFLPTISPHDPKTVLVRCDMTGAYITHDAGESWRMFNLRGVVRFFAFDPLDPKTIYAQTIGLWRSTDSGRTWRLLVPVPGTVTGIILPDDHAEGTFTISRPPGGDFTALAIDPADSRTLFATVADGGLWTSTDWGKSWKNTPGTAAGARRIYVDPGSPRADRTLYVAGDRSIAVRQAGVWRKGNPPEGASSFIDISAAFPHGGGRPVVYALTANGLHISSDGGATWRHSSVSTVEPAPDLAAVAASASDPSVAYVSYKKLHTISIPFLKYHFSYEGVARTSDQGRTWTAVWMESRSPAANVHDLWISAGLGTGWAENPLNLGVAPTNPNICYGTDYGRTMRTTDAGANWYGVYSKKAGDNAWTTNGMDVTTSYGVHFDPFDSRRVFISYTDIGLFRSEDGGKSWMMSSNGVPRPWLNTTYWMEFDPAVKGRVWAVMSGIHDLPRPKMWRRNGTARYVGGVVISDDGGKSWHTAGGLPDTAATHILLDPKSPAGARILFVTGCGRGVFKSADDGRTWALKNAGIEGGNPLAWRLARDRGGILYLVVARRTQDGSFGNAGDGALYRSRDGAEHWERLTLPKGLNGPNGILIDPDDPRRLYLASWGRFTPAGAVDGGIFVSSDAGGTWRNVLSKDQHIYDVTRDPRDAKILYACGFESSAWRSTDRGETWQRIKGYNFKWGHRVIPDPRDPRRIFITTFGGSVWYGPAAGDPGAVEDIVR